jgi:hypothetical protein
MNRGPNLDNGNCEGGEKTPAASVTHPRKSTKQENTEPAETEIYDIAFRCSLLFDRYISNPRASSIELAEEQRARFNTWSAYIGVFAEHSASLDNRLRDSPEIRSVVLRLLDVLQRNLQRGVSPF